jgi:hypothetical protein
LFKTLLDSVAIKTGSRMPHGATVLNDLSKTIDPAPVR